MEENCPFYDSIMTEVFKQIRCGVYMEKISKEHYEKFCESDNFCKCPYFISLCEKVSADDPEALEILNKLKGQTN